MILPSAIDPGVLEMMAGKDGKNIHEVVRILNKESGVLGLSDGFSSDFRDRSGCRECFGKPLRDFWSRQSWMGRS